MNTLYIETIKELINTNREVLEELDVYLNTYSKNEDSIRDAFALLEKLLKKEISSLKKKEVEIDVNFEEYEEDEIFDDNEDEDYDE